MKKIFFIAFGIILMQFSCSDDSEAPITEPTIYKKWYNKEIVTNGATEQYIGHESCGKDYFEFYDNNKVQTIDITNCEQDVLMSGTFVRNGNNIAITDDLGEIDTFQIVDLTDTTFAIKINEDIDGDGIIDEVIQKFTSY